MLADDLSKSETVFLIFNSTTCKPYSAQPKLLLAKRRMHTVRADMHVDPSVGAGGCHNNTKPTGTASDRRS